MNKIKCYIYNNIYQLLHITILQSSDSWRANMYQANTPYNILYRRLFTTSSLSTGQEICHFSLQKGSKCLRDAFYGCDKVKKMFWLCDLFILERQCSYSSNREQVMAQWWECWSPPTSVACAQIPTSNAICGLSLLLVLPFALRDFSPGNPVFPSPQKPTFPNSNLTGNQVDEEPLCGCATSKSLFVIHLKEMHGS